MTFSKDASCHTSFIEAQKGLQGADTKLLRAKQSSVKHDPDKCMLWKKRVKVHYTGYSAEHDEWRNREDIIEPTIV